MQKNEKISLLSLTGKDKDKAISALSENGKKEVKEITVTLRGETYRAVIVMDFTLIRKAMGALINTDITGQGNDANVNVSVDDLGAGDKLLFGGWHEGDEDVRRKVALRVKACRELGQWLQKYMNENEIDPESESEDEKKS